MFSLLTLKLLSNHLCVQIATVLSTKVRVKKVRHHCHTTGRFLGAVCAKCNLQLKYSNRKRPDNVNDEFFIPVIAHNMKNYDAHLIIKGYQRGVSYDISVISSNTEKFIAFQIGKLRFLDSFQFLTASLDKLVNTLPADAFKFTSKFSPVPHLAKQKGVYPYEYMTCLLYTSPSPRD